MWRAEWWFPPANATLPPTPLCFLISGSAHRSLSVFLSVSQISPGAWTLRHGKYCHNPRPSAGAWELEVKMVVGEYEFFFFPVCRAPPPSLFRKICAAGPPQNQPSLCPWFGFSAGTFLFQRFPQEQRNTPLLSFFDLRPLLLSAITDRRKCDFDPLSSKPFSPWTPLSCHLMKQAFIQLGIIFSFHSPP